MTERPVVGLYRSVVPSNMAGRHLQTRDPRALYRKALSTKTNPRTREYMREIFQDRFPGGEVVDVDRDPKWLSKAGHASSIVLLYPDPIGLGFSKVERAVRPSELLVLNGRRRAFRLNRRVRAALILRRGLAWSMAPEFAFTLAFALATPPLLVIDHLRGRR